MASKVYGVAVINHRAARAVDASPVHGQIRAVVRARSRAEAARYLATAGLYSAPGPAVRHLAGYGGVTGNDVEIAVCEQPGQVFVASLDGGRAQSDYHPWPLEA